MKWTPGGTSQDIEDRRGQGGGRFGGRGVGVGGLLILLVLSVVFRQNFFALLGGTDPGAPPAGNAAPATSTPEEEREVKFVSFVLDSAQSFWSRTFERAGRQYSHAKLVLFRDAVESACGMAQTASGPFYCPGDQKIYIDLGFYDELARRFGAPGEFAQAYVLAHEIGHHVQTLLGLEGKARRLQQADPDQANSISIELELQADCLAGVWGHSTAQMGILEPGDIDDGLRAAAAVGDDRLQRQTQGYVNPDAFTHGTSAQRTQWFRRGFDSGDIASCDTFGSR